MAERKFAHCATYCFERGKVKVQCRCGKNSPFFTGENQYEEAELWHIGHTGLKEVHPQKRSAS